MASSARRIKEHLHLQVGRCVTCSRDVLVHALTMAVSDGVAQLLAEVGTLTSRGMARCGKGCNNTCTFNVHIR